MKSRNIAKGVWIFTVAALFGATAYLNSRDTDGNLIGMMVGLTVVSLVHWFGCIRGLSNRSIGGIFLEIGLCIGSIVCGLWVDTQLEEMAGILYLIAPVAALLLLLIGYALGFAWRNRQPHASA